MNNGPQFIDTPTNQNVAIKPRVMIFNKFNINLKSFILPKSLDTFKNFIMVFEVRKDSNKYEELKSMLNGMLSQSKLVKGKKTKLNFNNTLSSKLDDSKVYFCDLRTDKDKDFELEIELNKCKWINDVIGSTLLSSTRGLIIFTDDIKDVPKSWISKSIAGLTSKQVINEFIKSGYGASNNNIEFKVDECRKEETLHGYIKMIRSSQFCIF
jgi:hypothetical protein